MVRKIAAGAVVLGLLVMLLPVQGVAARRVFLGSRLADFKLDHDEILVTSVRGEFSKLFFRVTRNDLEIFRLIVVFGNGQRDDIPVKLIFQEKERSRTIDLPGLRRFIRKIIFYYRTVGPLREGKADVRVWGIR